MKSLYLSRRQVLLLMEAVESTLLDFPEDEELVQIYEVLKDQVK